MTPLHLTLDEGEYELSSHTAHYLWTEGDRLHVTSQRPPSWATALLGYFSPMLGNWYFHLDAADSPRTLRLDGSPVTTARHRLPRPHAHVSLGAPMVGARPPSEPPSTTAPARQTAWVIGRIDTKADIKIDDPQVLGNHARLQIDRNGRWWVTAEEGPVYVNGVRMMSAALTEGDVFVVGQTAVTVSPSLVPAAPPVHLSAGRGLSLDLTGVTVRRDGTTLLDDVTFHVAPGEMVSIVGPSGSGKTSLVKLLLGEYQPDRGSVSIGAANGALRHQVRYVPQSDDLYKSLTVIETLTFAAHFRWGSHTSSSVVDAQVHEVMDWLGLTGRANTPVGKLSGGERRRVSIGIELVGRPQLLLLDEPTSGLDLGKDRDIMQRLQTISRELHCTVIVVTHTVAHLEEVEGRVVVLAKGGHIRYTGYPDRALADNGFATWADWMTDLDRHVRGRAAAPFQGSGGVRSSPVGARVTVSLTGFVTALRRQTALLRQRGTGSLAAMFGMPLLGTIVAVIASSDGLRAGGSITQVLAILVTIAALTGAALTYHDIVSEWSILRRDWRVGISAVPLVLAKATAYGAVCAALSAAMTAVFAISRELPATAFSVAPPLMLFLTLFSVMIGSMGIGMMISAVSESLERAVTWNTALAVLQVALNGSLFDVTWLHVADVLPARLGFAAMASYADLNRFRPPDLYRDALWDHAAGQVWALLTASVAVFVVTTAAAIFFAERGWRTGRNVG